MHRFYLPPDQCQGGRLTLEDREAHHGLHVLRLRPGERVSVLDGAGHEYLCEVRDAGRKAIHLEIRQQTFIPRLPCAVTLLQAIPKGTSFETILQKATELGAARVVPLLSERVVTQLDEDSSEHKLEKWRHTTIEAMKQCGNPWLPQLDPPLTPRAFLALRESFELPLIGSLQPDSRHPREFFNRFFTEHQRLPQSIAIWVGPEGDFTPAELSEAKSAGALPITLGRLVLRSETAAIYCLSIINYELQAVEARD